MTKTENIATRMFDTPLLIHPGKAATIAKAFGPRVLEIEAGGLQVVGAEADAFAASPALGSILNDGLSRHLEQERSGYIKHGNVAVITIEGSLVRRGSWLGKSSGMTSYEGLRAQLKAAAADSDMKAIALEFDSPGGEAAGCFELADLVREIRAQKPVYGFCAEYAYSAAYALASQCTYLTVPEYGGAGSIGVIMMHLDQSKNLEMQGLTVTIIRSGARKAEGNSVEPLPDDLRDEWQEEGDKMRVDFCALVEKGRGDRLSLAAAMKTEAKAFVGPEAVRLGLADKVADPKKAFDAMVASIDATGTWDGTVPASVPTLSSPGCTTRGVDPDNPKEATDMADKTKPDEKQAAGGAPESGTNVDAGKAKDAPKGNPDATAIVAAVARANLPAQFASKMIEDGLTYAEASSKIIDKMAADAADGGDIANEATTTKITGDGVDRMKAGMVEALSAKAGLKDGKRNEFSSMTLREMARYSLTQRGLAVNFSSGLEMVGAAFVPTMAGALHTTSDFGSVLADVANKSMLTGYQEQPEIFEMFTKVGSLTDFKPTKRVGTGAFPNLEKVAEGGEFNYGTMGDFNESILLATYGKLFAISRQAVINDDLGAFVETPNKMGRAAKRTVAAAVYAILNGNPDMSDGNALFSTAHKNLASSGSAPTEEAINAGITAMAEQTPRGTDPKSADDVRMNIPAKYILAAHSQRSEVLATLNSEHAPTTTNSKGPRRHNTAYKAAEPLFDSRISGNSWFMLADPNAFDTIEVAYLDGVSEPFIDQQDGWSVDGTEFKVRIDAGVSATGWEAVYKNAGQ